MNTVPLCKNVRSWVIGAGVWLLVLASALAVVMVMICVGHCHCHCCIGSGRHIKESRKSIDIATATSDTKDLLDMQNMPYEMWEILQELQKVPRGLSGRWRRCRDSSEHEQEGSIPLKGRLHWVRVYGVIFAHLLLISPRPTHCITTLNLSCPACSHAQEKRDNMIWSDVVVAYMYIQVIKSNKYIGYGPGPTISLSL